MTNYFYDIFGNATQVADPNRTTTIAPPACPNGQVPNWSGSGWACIAFTQPPSPIVVGSPAMMDAYDWYRGFTSQEVAAITTLSTTDATARSFLHILEMSIAAHVHVVSTDPALAAGLNYLSTTPSSGPCLTPARAAQMQAMV